MICTTNSIMEKKHNEADREGGETGGETPVIAAAAPGPMITTATTPATPLWLNRHEVEALMTLCLADSRPSEVNDMILEKLAMAWRRLS